MWYAQETEKLTDINAQFRALKGELENKESKITLAQFLRANLGLTTELISGIKLAPFQEVLLKGMLNNNFSMLVLGRGCGKTFWLLYFASYSASLNREQKSLLRAQPFVLLVLFLTI